MTFTDLAIMFGLQIFINVSVTVENHFTSRRIAALEAEVAKQTTS